MVDICVDAVKEITGVSDEDAQEIVDRIRKKQRELAATGQLDRSDEALRAFAKSEQDKLRLAAALQRKHVALNILKRRDVLDPHINSFLSAAGDPGGLSAREYASAVREAYQSLLYGSPKRVTAARKSINARRLAILGDEFLGPMTRELTRDRPHVLRYLRQDKDFLDAVVREMYELKPDGRPGITGNDDAQWTAGLLRKYTEAARIRMNDAGAFIQRLDGWAPQAHDEAKVLQAGKDQWIADIGPKLDLERSFPELTREEILDELGEIYENIVTGRDRKVRDQTGGFKAPRNLAKTLGRHRVLHFKTAEDWLSYAGQYSRGNVFTSVINHLERAARLASVMEILGPNPEVMLGSHLDATRDRIRQDPALNPEQKREALKAIDTDLARRTGTIGRAFSEVLGETMVPENLTWAKMGSGARALQSLAKLGSATLSSITDLLTYSMNLRFHGRNMFESYLDSVGTFLAGRTPQEKREISYVLGATYEGILEDIANRWHAQDSMPGKMSDWMDKFFKLSGLTWWTNRLRSGYARSISALMGVRSAKPWSALDEAYRGVMELHGIGEAEWGVIRAMAGDAEDGRRYVLPEDVERVPDEVIDGIIPDRENLKPEQLAKARARARKDFRTTLAMYFVDELNAAVIEPDDRTRALMLQGTRPGTLLGEVARFVTQFKSFPIAYTQRILASQRWRRPGREVDPLGLASLIAGTLITGYAAMTMKDLVKGRTPRDPRHFETWMAAALQGGGAGIYGDFLFGKVDRFGGGLVETLAGPTIGSVGDAHRLINGLVYGEASAGDAFYTALNNTPYVNLWWTRAAMDYMVLYHLQEMFGPGVLARRERKIKEEYGQEYIFPPSKVIKRGGGFR